MAWYKHLSRERETSRFAKRVAVVSLKKSNFSYPSGVVKGTVSVPRGPFDMPAKKTKSIRPPKVLNERPNGTQGLKQSQKNKIIYAQWQRASDRRRFHPAGQNAWPSSVYGAAAQLLKNTTPPKFSTSSLPCVDRQIRRSVMFAKKKAGTAYHKKKRRTWRSNIHC